jgi:hypothetical protein
VFSYYRWILAARYEAKLEAAGLEHSVLAYRRISTPKGSGKSNINFAFEAFKEVEGHDSSVAVALDISKFFESLDHARLEDVWADLLDLPSLPPDHAHVLRNITRYADVSRDEAYVRLGHAQWVPRGAGRWLKTSAKPVPIQLCSMAEFREKIAGKGGKSPKLVERHLDPYGVPQGAPLSDLLANAYLFEFDIEMQNYVAARGGTYCRYSDDILIIIPSKDPKHAEDAERFAVDRIQTYGSALRIKPSKTSSYLYERRADGHAFKHLRGKGVHGLEYLGFRFDGHFAHIRSSTLSRLHRNMTIAARTEAYNHVARYPGKSLVELLEKFNLASFMQRFGRVKDFSPSSDPKDWTFWTYAVRSRRVFSEMGRPIEMQLARHRRFVRKRVDAEIARAYRAICP